MSYNMTQTAAQISAQGQPTALSEMVCQTLRGYFAEAGNVPMVNLYAILLEQVEEPLLHMLMDKYRHNQSKVARILGLSRGTTRKLLKKYGLID